jgi:16S rRNA (cytosine967-C5)-methyltransferase
MFWLDRVPDHAAVHETVSAATHLGCVPQAGFINAILRGYGREREATVAELAELSRRDPALGASHPQWLHERWRARFGEENAARLMDWNNSRPPTFARVNTLKTTAAALAEMWPREHVAFTPCRWDWTCEPTFRLESHPPLATLPSFQNGSVYVQDPSTLLAPRMLDAQPGEEILDLCAAPGGKTTCIAQHADNAARITAADISAERLDQVTENCQRLGVTCVETCLASTLPPGRPFDRVLLDVPCSNTGVLRRRVDLRWRILPAEITRLAAKQAALLETSAPRVKPGGVLVFSTCSLETEENHAQIAAFTAAHPEFALDAERQLTPFADGVDGAFVAVLRRKVR